MGLDAYLKLDTIKGDALDSKHRDWVAVESFSWGVGKSGIRPGVTTLVKPTFKVFSVVKLVDKTSPLLLKACASGQRLKICTLEVQELINDEPEIVYGVNLMDCTIASINTVDPSALASRQGEGLADSMFEEVAFTYLSITTQYRAFNEDGTPGATTTGGWSISASGPTSTPFMQS